MTPRSLYYTFLGSKIIYFVLLHNSLNSFTQSITINNDGDTMRSSLQNKFALNDNILKVRLHWRNFARDFTLSMHV